MTREPDQIIVQKADPVGATQVYAIVLTIYSGYRIHSRLHSTYETREERDEAFLSVQAGLEN